MILKIIFYFFKSHRTAKTVYAIRILKKERWTLFQEGTLTDNISLNIIKVKKV